MSTNDRNFVTEYNGDDKQIVPVSFVTPEMRCACAEERMTRMLELGMSPAEIINFITFSESLSHEHDDD